MLGVLTLDTAFPRIAGDIGARETFPFPARHATVAGAGVEGVVHDVDHSLLPAFVAAAQSLEGQGCIALTTTCGFLARWQRELAGAVRVPVLASALLQLGLVQRCLPNGRRVGIVTYSAEALTPALLEAAGADPRSPVAGVAPDGYFARLIRQGGRDLDRAAMARDVVAAARRLVAAHADVGAIVLECANMPPYRGAVAAAVALPVFDAFDLICWFYAGVAGRDVRGELW